MDSQVLLQTWTDSTIHSTSFLQDYSPAFYPSSPKMLYPGVMASASSTVSYVVKSILTPTFKTRVLVFKCAPTHLSANAHACACVYPLTIAFWAMFTYRYFPWGTHGPCIPMAQACIFRSAQEGSIIIRYYVKSCQKPDILEETLPEPGAPYPRGRPPVPAPT